MLVRGRARARGCARAVRAVSLVVIGEYFGTVGQCRVVDNVVEGDDFRVICTCLLYTSPSPRDS